MHRARSARKKGSVTDDKRSGGREELRVVTYNGNNSITQPTQISFRDLRTDAFSPRIYSDAKLLLDESTYARLVSGLKALRHRPSEIGRSALFALYGIYALLSYRWHPAILPLGVSDFFVLYGRLWGTDMMYDDLLSFLAWVVGLTERPDFTEADVGDMSRMILLPQDELAPLLTDKIERYPYLF